MSNTLSAPLLLQRFLTAFRTMFPMMKSFATDFSDKPLRLGDTVTAKVEVLPSISTYDANNGGYEAGANESRDLLVDLPIKVDNHKHVAIKGSHLNLIKDQISTMPRTITNAMWVLGRAMIDSVLGKVRGSTFSQKTVDASPDLDTLETVTSGMNMNGASPGGRVGIISTAFAQALASDTRVTSVDFYGQKTGGKGYRVFYDLGGFEAIYEYPSFPNNNRPSQTFTVVAATDVITAVGHGLLNGDRVRVSSDTALPAGLAAATDYYVISATADTFKLSLTDGGASVDITNTGTGTHSVVGYENLIGFFFESAAVAIRAGIPEQSAEVAREMGIPQTMLMESMKDPETGFLLALLKWMKTGTMDLYVAVTSIWGSSLGRQAETTQGAITDKAGWRVVSA